MTYQTLILETPEPGIALLTINRPKALNALSPEVLRELMAALCAIESDPATRCLLVTGGGSKAFVAGADIAAMRGLSPLEGREFALEGHACMRMLELLPFPVIALVNGYALGGGCELALACDWIIAAENAVFGQPEVNLGIAPGFGGTQRLTRLVGKARALEIICTGRQLKADEALAMGLVNRVVPADALMEQGLEQARLVAAKAPVAIKMSKHLVQRGQDLDLANANALEADVFGLLCATEDRSEGMAAFLEKRPAKFVAR
ncbi:MAG: enoyl-CoA hydratase-related protein [Casimicrobiaceae bacterium]